MFELVIFKRDKDGRKTNQKVSYKRDKAHQLSAIYYREVVIPEQKKK